MHHCLHGSIAIIAQTWKQAGITKQPINTHQINVKAVNKCCANTTAKYPDWPAILFLTDLSNFAKDQAINKQWWLPRLPEPLSDDSADRKSSAIL